MSREAFRAWLDKELQVNEDWLEAIWDTLDKDGWLDLYDRGDPTARADILHEATSLRELLYKRLPHVAPLHSAPERLDRSVPTEVSIDLGDYSRRRAETASEVAAAFANMHPDVRRFRRIHLGGEGARLTEEQAQAFLEDLPTGEILEELLSLAKRLGWRYRWTYQDTWRFLLTGTVPHIVPLRVHYNYVRDEPESPEPHYPNMAEITLIVEPWVDARDVERIYRNVQRQVLGGDNRKNDKRTLEAIRFAARQMREHGRKSWAEIVRHWNTAQTDPKRRYDSRGGLQQAFKRFVRTTYNEPQYKAAEPTSLSPHQF